MADKSKTLLIIDSHALIYRAYYAFPASLTTSKGEPINAVYGFTSLLLDVILKFSPTHVIAVMDSGGPIARQADYSFYKSNRDSADDLMITQFPRMEQMLESFEIPLLKIDGVEADDIIGTIDKTHSGKWAKTIVVTGDQDLFQLVDEDTFIYLAGRLFSQSKLYDEVAVKEKLGIAPVQVTDYKSLAGDASDNIPGVRGVGPKTAVSLINEFGTLENLYANVEKVKESVRTKLVENHDLAFLSKKLATIDRDVPISFDITSAKFENLNIEKIKTFFQEMEFRTLANKVDKLAKIYTPAQGFTLFDTDTSDGNSPEQSKVVTEAWGGGEVDSDSVYIIAEFAELDKSPLEYKIQNLWAATDDSDRIFKVEQNQMVDFFKKNEGKKIITYEYKKIVHSLVNLGVSAKDYKFEDIGFIGVIQGGGRVNYALNSILHFLKQNYSGDHPSDLLNIREAYKEASVELSSNQRNRDLINLEYEVIAVVVEMERNGITLDVSTFEEFLKLLEKQRDDLKTKIYEDVGHEFNINSPKQVSEVLFVEKSLAGGRKTKSGGFSTDERSLKALLGVDPIIESLLNFRAVDKLLSTYLKPLPEYINPKTNRIHGSFDQLGAVSGRFSSKNPNLQNIPKGEAFGINVRNAFVSGPKKTFISFDYSQQELRILAALSGEEDMINSFNTNQDIHKMTAAEIFGLEEDKVSSDQRDKGKTINFSIIYGISSFGLSERMDISRADASMFIQKYFERYKKVKEFMDKTFEQARSQGYSETILGRRRYNEMITSNNRNFRAAAERELFNFIIQGSAADIMKLAMKNFSSILSKYGVKMILQIHDEFLFECDTEFDEIEKDKKCLDFIDEIYHTMTTPYDIGVVYKVDVNVGTRWGDLRKLTQLT